jgi:CBS domain-containing protein
MMTTRDVMTRPVVTVKPETLLKEVAQLLIDHRISGLPVVDPDGSVLGIVSEADFLIKEVGGEALPHRRLARFRGESRGSRAQQAKLVALTAGEAMTSPALTISSGCRIAEAATLMTSRGVNRLPVVDDGRLVGIVTRADLVRAYVRSDDALASTIRDDVLLRILGLDPAIFTVVVVDGAASIVGHVERRSIAELVEQAVAMVPGIMNVHAELTWAHDDRRSESAALDSFFPAIPR